MLVKQGCKPKIGDVLVAKDGSILKYAFEVKENQDVVILSSIAILKPEGLRERARQTRYQARAWGTPCQEDCGIMQFNQ